MSNFTAIALANEFFLVEGADAFTAAKAPVVDALGVDQ